MPRESGHSVSDRASGTRGGYLIVRLPDNDNNGLIFRQQGANPMRMKTLVAAATCFVALLAGLAPATAQTRTTLDIYVVDVEGGNATLFVSPSGESVLIDTGNFAPEAAIRDA